jgi:hypothetical protein
LRHRSPRPYAATPNKAPILLAAMDIFSDLKEGTTFSHILSEASGKAGPVH